VTGDLAPPASVVASFFNNVSFIEATMDSILAQRFEDMLAQRFEDFELIVADHSSADGDVGPIAALLTDPTMRLLRRKADEAPREAG
jgi:glycosyltransferase involved in cell wall biosynthesis